MTGQTVILNSSHARSNARRLCDIAPPGTVATFRPARRTTAQNDLMWTLLSIISRAKPQDRTMAPDKWKGVFLDAIGKKPEWVPSLDGESVVCTGYRSSRLTKAEMSEVIEQIYAYGAEHGVDFSETANAEAA